MSAGRPFTARAHAGARWRGVAVLTCAVLLGLAGCASGPKANPRDPFEPYNRSITRFNDAVDKAVLKPVAIAYKDVAPKPVRTGVSNFFGNLSDGWSVVNNALQFKGQATAESVMRVSVNTVFGLGGLLDIASEMGIERRTEDFGQTLGHWGVPSGPYLVLPLLGPSTVRDTAALPVDSAGNPLSQVDPTHTRNSLYGLRIIDTRAMLLGATNLLGEVALDPYTFTRDFYLQKRRNDVYDGMPPSDAPAADEENWDDSAEPAPAEAGGAGQ